MPPKLTPTKRKALESLMTSGSVTDAAKAAQVSRDTLYRWLRDNDFRQALTEAEGESLAALSRSLVRMGEEATATLSDAMRTAHPIAARIRAAEIVLARLLQLREIVDLEARISRLEAAQK